VAVAIAVLLAGEGDPGRNGVKRRAVADVTCASCMFNRRSTRTAPVCEAQKDILVQKKNMIPVSKSLKGAMVARVGRGSPFSAMLLFSSSPCTHPPLSQATPSKPTPTSSSSEPKTKGPQVQGTNYFRGEKDGKGAMKMAQADEELRMKLEGISGDGGASGVEYENGKAEGLKRSVKSNMFRYI